ncbi:Spliceosomal protein DIB1 [Nosema granulosis]|uniref:Spliceosomal protein DIB1 n=1 Tax=Nosema granulosis TaxID=83296 RepID=A0A9P6GXB7_9MICR|nr:Spliceosomal protein DIB1 [Nosema granulosis]
MSSLNSIDEINAAVSNNKNVMVVIRFGDIDDPLCVLYDEMLDRLKNKVRKFVKIFRCEKENIPEIQENMKSPASLLVFYNCKLIKEIEYDIEDEELLEILQKIP